MGCLVPVRRRPSSGVVSSITTLVASPYRPTADIAANPHRSLCPLVLCA